MAEFVSFNTPKSNDSQQDENWNSKFAQRESEWLFASPDGDRALCASVASEMGWRTPRDVKNGPSSSIKHHVRAAILCRLPNLRRWFRPRLHANTGGESFRLLFPNQPVPERGFTLTSGTADKPVFKRKHESKKQNKTKAVAAPVHTSSGSGSGGGSAGSLALPTQSALPLSASPYYSPSAASVTAPDTPSSLLTLEDDDSDRPLKRCKLAADDNLSDTASVVSSTGFTTTPPHSPYSPGPVFSSFAVAGAAGSGGAVTPRFEMCLLPMVGVPRSAVPPLTPSPYLGAGAMGAASYAGAQPAANTGYDVKSSPFSGDEKSQPYESEVALPTGSALTSTPLHPPSWLDDLIERGLSPLPVNNEMDDHDRDLFESSVSDGSFNPTNKQ